MCVCQKMCTPVQIHTFTFPVQSLITFSSALLNSIDVMASPCHKPVPMSDSLHSPPGHFTAISSPIDILPSCWSVSLIQLTPWGCCTNSAYGCYHMIWEIDARMDLLKSQYFSQVCFVVNIWSAVDPRRRASTFRGWWVTKLCVTYSVGVWSLWS